MSFQSYDNMAKHTTDDDEKIITTDKFVTFEVFPFINMTIKEADVVQWLR